MLYSIRNLKKTYNGQTVLHLPQLSLEKGRIYGLLGPNGSGKTTLLHVLSFLESPSVGTIFYEDKPVSFVEKSLQKLRREVVLVDQHPILFSTSVHKNVAFGLRVRKIPKQERKKIVEECLDMVGMRDFRHARGHHLSGGETQRVAIARALACSPKVMLFDEPTASVDVSSQIAIENIIRDLHTVKGITIIFSTHALLQASKLADEKLFLFKGRQSAFVHENIFSGKVVTKAGRTYCRVDEKLLVPVKTDKHGRIEISINPKSLRIFHHQNEMGHTVKGAVMSALSGENRDPQADRTNQNASEMFKGRIFQLTQEKTKIRVLADVGIPLSIVLKKKEYDELGICIGDDIMVRCSEYGVEVMDARE